MKFSQSNWACGVKLAFASLILAVGAAQAADAPAVSQTAASAVVKTTTRVTPTGKSVPKVTATTGAITSKGDDNQYPAGTIPVPPKPKKEGLEQTPAIKANVKAAP